ncbi:major facilitator superfamily domain-containing protein [Microdochium trichocladiopsis]|uniref:Major facilitator superfamily domain-containing protein n=1 Tax=Microdochium trichocladiopsis TaxID=1682393 RepID=A0A9P9BUP3_9PEZI|nr:major facilitator superfamily domain-containing protein [Microdochium trichocladiopsis]KAH7038367.1 major facilitator superfamily domain-containing protein [Microdochium trichocladiopsis]
MPAAEDSSKTEAGPCDSWTPEEEKKALRKLDWCLIPLVGSLYMVSYIDRGNIGNAYTAGMGKEWGINSDDYSWIVTAYYLAYIAFHWLILAWKVVSLPTWTCAMAMGWGIASILQACTSSLAGIVVLRVLIGVFEAGFVPAVALYLTFFYHRKEMGLRYGLFISASPLANCFASALAYGIVQAKTSIKNWQLLFIIEGIPTLFLAGVAYFYLPASPGQCRFLTARQNEIISRRAVKGRGQDTERKLDFKQVFSAFYDYKNYLQAAIIFCLNTAFGSLPAYLPTILADMGYTSINAQGLSACPYIAAWFVCVGTSMLSDRVAQRGVFVVFFSLVGAAGYTMMSQLTGTAVRYASTFLVCAGVFPAVALTFTWTTDNQGSSSKRGAGLAIFGMIGQCGPILGARIFPKSDGPYYHTGMLVCAGVLFGAALVATVLSVCLRLQNRHRDRVYGKVEDVTSVPEDVADKGDSHPMYRYVV